MTWSPDGTRLALFTDTLLKIINEDGSGLIEMDAAASRQRRVSWSPDGRKLVLTDWGGNGINIVDVSSRVVTSIDLQWPEGPEIVDWDGEPITFWWIADVNFAENGKDVIFTIGDDGGTFSFVGILDTDSNSVHYFEGNFDSPVWLP